MTVKYKEGHVDSCVIVAEADGFKNSYYVAPEDADKSMKLIKSTLKSLGKKDPKIYVSGFTLVTKNTNLSKSEIVDKVFFWEEFMQSKQNNDTIEFHK